MSKGSRLCGDVADTGHAEQFGFQLLPDYADDYLQSRYGFSWVFQVPSGIWRRYRPYSGPEKTRAGIRTSGFELCTAGKSTQTVGGG